MTSRPNVAGARRAGVFLFIAAALAAAPASAELSVTPITWDVVGLDSNRPLTSGPELFPVGARVCSDTATTDPLTVSFSWPDAQGAGHPFINSRPGSLTSLEFPALGAGECVDAYFELQLTRTPAAFGQSREYVIQATDGVDSASSPTPRAIYVESLVSQNRNTTTQIRWGQDPNPTTWQALGAGGTISLAVGETYFIELTTQTATSYEELQSFITLSNTIFQVLSVSTTYSVLTNTDGRVPVPNPSLWADGCLWDSDPTSPSYLSCLDDGKAGGTVVTVYQIRIISTGGDTVGLEALIYDRSGSSFHYNTDYSESPGDITTVDPTTADFAKRFVPDIVAADGTATLRLTITNPNPLPISGYRFDDVLPTSMSFVNGTIVGDCGGGTTAISTTTNTNDTFSLTDGALPANSSCTILVNVTVPFDGGATYPLTLNNSVDLFVGAATAPSATATASLVVTEEPLPPLDCADVPAGTTLAAWATFDSAAAPSPTTDVTGTAAAQGGAGLNFSISATPPAWEARAPVTGQTLANAISTAAYYEFRLDTTGIDSIDFSLEAYRQNGNAPESLTLLYGPVGSLVQSTTLSPVPTQNNRPGANNFQATGLTNLNPSGETVFRLYAYGASNANQPVRVLNVLIQGSGTICIEFPPGSEPDPPTISKAFSPDTVGVGAFSTLTFTLGNPITNTQPLSGLTFRDVLPAGMTVVSGTFVNSCNVGSTWGTEGGDAGILLFTDGTLAVGASCTLSVDVVSTTVGDNVNVSDPVDATETLPGNSAVATLTVTPPPTPPAIAKSFDPNPLLDPTGATTTTLTFEITNTDPTLDISGVAFADALPSGMSFVTGTIVGDCGGGTTTISTTTNTNDTFTLSDGAITAGGSCSIEVDVAITAVDVSGGPVTFPNQTGLVSHVYNGITYEGNDAEATLVVDNPIPDIAIRKQVGLAADPAGTWSDYVAVTPGTPIYYKLTVENVGETELTNIAVTDPMLVLSSCTWPATLPVADAADPLAHIAECVVGPVTTVAGSRTNTAEASGESGTTTVTDTDTATYATVTLTLDKAASPLTFNLAGEVINYTYTVTNAGFASLPGPVTVSDDLIPSVSCPSLTTVGNNDTYFDRLEVIVCTGSYTIQAADVAAGSVTNTARASVGGFQSNPDLVTVVRPAGTLTLVKSVFSGSPYDAVGDAIAYRFFVENTGAVSLAGPVVIDDDLTVNELCPAVTTVGNGDSFLDPGESIECSASYLVTQADLDNGSITNTATASAGGTTSNTDTATAVATQLPALTLDKQIASGDPYDSVGDVISYQFLVTNSGNLTLAGPVVVVDDRTTDESCPAVTTVGNGDGNFDPGESIVCTASYTVTQADLDAGSVVNDAQATADAVLSNVDTATATAIQTASLTITKTQTSGPDPVTAAGNVIGYTIVVTNTGTVSQTGVSVSDTLPDGSPGTLTGPTESITTNGILDVGETWTYTISYTVTQTDIDAGTNLVNTASVTTTQVPGPTTATETTSVSGTASLTITKTQTSGPDPVTAAGNVIGYTVVVTNTGTVSQTGVNVSDTLPDGTPGTLTGPTESITTNGILDVGETWTYTISYTVTQTDIDAGTNLVNTASVVTTQVPGPTTATETTSVSGTASLTITKTQTSGPDPVTAAGNVIGYTIVVTNTGTVSQTGVSVSDTLPDGTPGTLTGPTESITTNGILDVGETWTYTISYTVTQTDIDAGANLVNTASVTTTQVPGPTTATETTPVSGSASLTITKTQTSGPDPVTADGDVIGYTIVVTNTGTVSQTGVVVSDTLPDGTPGTLTGPTESITTNGVLDVGETWTYTISYTVTQTDIDAGADLVNTASVVTNEVPGPTEATETTPVSGSASLTITKTQTSGPSPVDTAGDVIGYTIVVTNTGTVSQTGVVVSDTLPDGTPGTVTGPTESITPDGILDVGETWTYTISYTVTQTDIDAGIGLINVAGVVTDQVPGPTEDRATTPVLREGGPEVVVSKSADPPDGTGVVPGDTITYTLTAIVGVAPTTATVELTDTLGPGLTLLTASLPAECTALGQVVTCTLPSNTVEGVYDFVYQATVDTDAAGTVGNSVVITDGGGDPEPECTSCTTSHPLDPQISVSKTSVVAPGTVVAPGDTITYTLTVVVSNGPTTADVILTDTLATSLTFGQVTANPGGFVGGGTDNVRTFTLPSGAADGVYEVEYTVTVNPDATGTVSNSVVIEGGGDSDPECTSCSTSHPIADDSVAIPTASTWSTILLILLLAGAGFLHLRWRS